MIGTTHEMHPLALRVPSMTEAEFEALREDIATNGLMRPITLYEGKVLDGRHRLRACEDTGVEPRFEEFEGDSPATFVVSLNAKRRNLTKGQLAFMAQEFREELKIEAREHSLANLRRGAESPTVSVDTFGKRSAEIAGEIVGVSPYSVNRAARVQRDDPDLAERVKAGEVSLRSAHDDVLSRQQPTRDGTRKHSAESLVQNLVDKWALIPMALREIDTQAAIASANGSLKEWDKKLTDAIQALNRLRGDIRKEMSK